MKDGDKVVIASRKYCEYWSHIGEVFTVVGEPYDLCGTRVVFLKELGCCFACDGLALKEVWDKHEGAKRLRDPQL